MHKRALGCFKSMLKLLRSFCNNSMSHSALRRLGILVVLGPAPLVQDRTCVSGHVCSLSGFQGEGLTLSDEIRIMDTCGLDEVIPRAPRSGHFTLVSRSGAAVTWGAQQLTAAGGIYRLCWWSGFPSTVVNSSVISNPDTPGEEFVVDMGKLEIIGPTPLQQHRTCVSGQTCHLVDVEGLSLASSNKWMVLDTCGRAPQTRGIGPDLIAASGLQWIWSEPLSAAGGEYRLCWCASLPLANHFLTENNVTNDTNLTGYVEASNQTVALDCILPQEFSVDVGKFSVIGVAPLEQHRTCVSGQSCRFSGISLENTPGDPGNFMAQPPAKATGFRNSNSICRSEVTWI